MKTTYAMFPISLQLLDQIQMTTAHFRARRLPLFSIPIPQIPRSLSTSAPEPELEPESETRISAAVTILLQHRSKTRWNHLKSALLPIGSSFSPPESAHIILRIRSKPHLALRFFNTPLCSRDLETHATIIHVLARARLRPEALSHLKSAILSRPESDNPLTLFQTLASTYRSCDSAPFVFDLLIKAYLQFKKIDFAVQIARILRSRGIQLLVSTSNSLIRSVSQSQGSDAGFELYKELFDHNIRVRARVSPSVSTFNTLLLAFYREGKLEVVDEIKKEMARFDCEANVFTYSIMMAGFCDEGMIDEATKIWNEMAENGIKADVLAYNTMIKGHCEAKEMEKAEELFKELGLSEIVPSCATFEHLIQGYCRVEDVDSALVLCRDMRRRGFGMENWLVDEVIEGLCKRKRVSEGLRFLREEMRREGFEPARRSYELLIAGFCKEGETEMAMKIQAEMAGKGFGVNSKIHGYFIEACLMLGDEEKAKKLEKEMLEMSLKTE